MRDAGYARPRDVRGRRSRRRRRTERFRSPGDSPTSWPMTRISTLRRLDSATGTQLPVRRRSGIPLSYIAEEIPVKGDSSGVPLTVRLTRHGPIVTDIQTLAAEGESAVRRQHALDGERSRTTSSMPSPRSTGRATGRNSPPASGEFAVPGQNFVYGGRRREHRLLVRREAADRDREEFSASPPGLGSGNGMEGLRPVRPASAPVQSPRGIHCNGEQQDRR